MKVLVLNQKVTDSYMDVIKAALPHDAEITLITGSQMERYAYVKAPAHNPDSLMGRMKCWLQFYRFVMKWAKQQKQSSYDLIYATSNPPINGLLGVRLKKVLKAKFVYMNWDLYPQVIENSMKGLIPTVFSALWHGMNRIVYPKVDQMVTIGEVMSQTINEPLKQKIDVAVVPMYTDTQRLHPIPKKDNAFCIQQGISDKFVVLFSGKMGLGHNIELLLEASQLLREEKDILFLLIGHGQKYDMVEKWIAEHQPSNVRLLPLQPEEVFPLSMAAGDIGFISQEKEAAKCFMPAKTYDMMACGMALITYSEGTDDLTNLVRSRKLGMAMTNNDPRELADNILKLYQDRELLAEYGTNSRNATMREFDIQPIVKRYGAVFQKVVQ